MAIEKMEIQSYTTTTGMRARMTPSHPGAVVFVSEVASGVLLEVTHKGERFRTQDEAASHLIIYAWKRLAALEKGRVKEREKAKKKPPTLAQLRTTRDSLLKMGLECPAELHEQIKAAAAAEESEKTSCSTSPATQEESQSDSSPSTQTRNTTDGAPTASIPTDESTTALEASPSSPEASSSQAQESSGSAEDPSPAKRSASTSPAPSPDRSGRKRK